MIQFRRLQIEDYEDILEISKDIWGGTDYLPKVFHKWIEANGFFIGAVDSENNKVIAVSKLTFLPDGSGWLEGLRVHTAYRKQGLGRKITMELLDIARKEQENGRIKNIALATHVTNKESISIMESLNFKVAEAQLLVVKEKVNALHAKSLKDFEIEPWEISYEAFMTHPYIQKRNGLIPLAFTFQKFTREFYEGVKKEGGFVRINGHEGIFKYKGEPNFLALGDSFEAIDTFMDYYLLRYEDEVVDGLYTPVLVRDTELINKLKTAGYSSWNNWHPDYLYYVYMG